MMSTKYTQAALLLIAVIFIFLIYQLPTSVIDNKDVENQVNENFSIEKAIELVEGENPMEGIFMLRDIIDKNPENTDALYYLGVLSLQTAQYENAVKRFNQIISIDSSDKRAYLQLGISNHNLGNKEKADSLFNIIRNSEDKLLIEELDNFLNN
mgnify:CR=1 FL=1